MISDRISQGLAILIRCGLTPDAILHIGVCSARDALFGVVSINEAGHTYGKYRIQGKCGYLCLSPNALLCIAICSVEDAILGIVSIYEAGDTYTG